MRLRQLLSCKSRIYGICQTKFPFASIYFQVIFRGAQLCWCILNEAFVKKKRKKQDCIDFQKVKVIFCFCPAWKQPNFGPFYKITPKVSQYLKCTESSQNSNSIYKHRLSYEVWCRCAQNSLRYIQWFEI